MMTPSQTRLQAARSAVPMLMVVPRLSRVVGRCSGEMPSPSPSPLVLAPPSGSSCEDGVSCPSASLGRGASVSVGLGAPARFGFDDLSGRRDGRGGPGHRGASGWTLELRPAGVALAWPEPPYGKTAHELTSYAVANISNAAEIAAIQR